MTTKLTNLKQTIQESNQEFDTNYEAQVQLLYNRLKTFSNNVSEIDLKIRTQTEQRTLTLHETQNDFQNQIKQIYAENTEKLNKVKNIQEEKMKNLTEKSSNLLQKIQQEQEDREQSIKGFQGETQERIDTLLTLLAEIETQELENNRRISTSFNEKNLNIKNQLETRRKESEDRIIDMKKEIDQLFESRKKELEEVKNQISALKITSEQQIQANLDERIINEQKLTQSLELILSKIQATLQVGTAVFD